MTAAIEVTQCIYCKRAPAPDLRVYQWGDLSARKRFHFLSARGRFPVCHYCRITVQNGRQPGEKTLVDLLAEKVTLAAARKHKTAKPTDIPALRKLADETAADIESMLLCEKQLQDRIDEIPGLPDNIANARKGTVLRFVRKLNSIGNRIREINAYVSQHIEIDYEAARRRANNATRPEWVRLRVMMQGGGKCRYCESTENLSIDHALPVFRGGNSEEKNLQLLCRKCNSAKGIVDRHIGT